MKETLSSAERKVKSVREPSKQENSRGLAMRRYALVFMSWLKP